MFFKLAYSVACKKCEKYDIVTGSISSSIGGGKRDGISSRL